jgi:hypothetical protein
MRNFLRISMTLLAIFVLQVTHAQESVVTGKVTASEDGSPIPGVNVFVEGTTSGTVTDFDGNYRLDVPADGGVLVFRFIGLTTVEDPLLMYQWIMSPHNFQKLW